MSKSFEPDIFKAVVGKFNFHQGITLSTSLLFERQDWRATEKHELIHMELIDNSIFGYFQRLLLSLIYSPIVPQEHKKIYKTVFNETMKNSFMVQEGLASYRALTWYVAYSNEARVFLKHLPNRYKEALNLVLQLLPDYRVFNDSEFQAGIHALCEVLGCYLLNPPIPIYYKDWNLLQAPKLEYINTKGPDDRLKDLIGYKKTVSAIMTQEFKKVSKIISENIPRTGGLGSEYWMWFDTTILLLKKRIPEIPVCGFFERGELFLTMLENWGKQIQREYEYGQYLFTDEIKSRLSKKPRDVGIEKLIYEVTFANLNAGTKLNDYNEITLQNISRYLKRVSEITENGNIPFIVTVANPTREEIQLTEHYKLSPNTIGCSLFAIKIDELNNFNIQIENLTIYNFAGSLTDLFEATKKLPQDSVIQYLNSYHYSLLIRHQRKFNNFYIVRVINHRHFQESFHINDISCCFFYYNNKKTAFCYYNEKENSLYFYIVNLMQEIDIKHIVTNKLPYDPKRCFCNIGNNKISMEQLALLAFWGLSL
jgi:hypothetical protein